MSSERDLQANTAVMIDDDAITVSQAGTSYSATIIDTYGMRNLQVVITLSRALGAIGVDDPRILFQDSPDAVTYTAVDAAKVLPTRNFDAAGQILFNPAATTNQWVQTVGLTSVARYVRVGVVATVLGSSLTVGFGAIMQPELKAFTDYDPNFVLDLLP